jgi:hypothetical protein
MKDENGRTCMGKMKDQNPEKGYHLGFLGLNGRIILKWISQELYLKLWVSSVA